MSGLRLVLALRGSRGGNGDGVERRRHRLRQQGGLVRDEVGGEHSSLFPREVLQGIVVGVAIIVDEHHHPAMQVTQRTRLQGSREPGG